MRKKEAAARASSLMIRLAMMAYFAPRTASASKASARPHHVTAPLRMTSATWASAMKPLARAYLSQSLMAPHVTMAPSAPRMISAPLAHVAAVNAIARAKQTSATRASVMKPRTRASRSRSPMTPPVMTTSTARLVRSARRARVEAVNLVFAAPREVLAAQAFAMRQPRLAQAILSLMGPPVMTASSVPRAIHVRQAHAWAAARRTAPVREISATPASATRPSTAVKRSRSLTRPLAMTASSAPTATRVRLAPAPEVPREAVRAMRATAAYVMNHRIAASSNLSLTRPLVTMASSAPTVTPARLAHARADPLGFALGTHATAACATSHKIAASFNPSQMARAAPMALSAPRETPAKRASAILVQRGSVQVTRVTTASVMTRKTAASCNL